MQINHLKITNFRGFEQAEFEFQPGMNLIVGINGVGKSSVLDALRIAFSRILPELTDCQERRINFNIDDIMIGKTELKVEINVDISGIPFRCKVSRGKRHEQELKPDGYQILGLIKDDPNQPLVVYCATRRSIVTEQDLNPNRSLGNQSAAFVDALIPRMLRLREFIDWWLVQEELLDEKPQLTQGRIDALNDAVTCFLDWCNNVRAVPASDTYKKPTLLLDKNGVTLNINQLSDGERGILALILDLVQRLLQANPELENPVQDGKAVVLIDELDLHLHPQWQRMVVHKLTEIFPNCQFIATTHSPQMIGEVKPENIIILDQDKQPYIPDQSLGMDSNWILRFLMETPERDMDTQKKLEDVESLIADKNFSEATEKINSLRQLGEFPELVRLQTRIDRISRLGK
ncbi:MAG: AAA family ATPase [Limnospira sp. PMC 1291.21]|uniref:SMC domain protein n=2 Tax=Limnospira TaxID=2596745 RepID=B5VW67_LIMMA|nr:MULTISPECIES: AAA family ATPase [Limnospira]MDC0839321.1 AAA family ATPase [Limnoraphis robusta]MDY7051794.1 AAA family ATPase [Limnospira fusiformis LS22]EDZ96428.1 SMC domain protein [Limnospira maxima CS-328]MDT9176517.1 AAA family ATPase [Limnospira sp. PMC 1238.20]MDT9186236.1 AAA family ATPase [Limnospira sp. PMC 894.15]